MSQQDGPAGAAPPLSVAGRAGLRIALYGDVDLNLVDGSAIWLVALADTLTLGGDVHVTVVLKAPLRRDVVAAPLLGRDEVTLVDPQRPRLSPGQALDLLEELDRRERFDAVVLRGYALCQSASARPALAGRLLPYLTDIPQQAWRATDADREALAAIAAASQRVLCQTDELRAYLEGLVPEAAGRTALLTPMVPASFLLPAREPPETPRLLYAGKFAPAWGFLETVAAFVALREHHPGLELHVAGDKVHDPPDDPDFAPAVRAALEGTPGLVWHGAVTRDQVAGLLVDTTVALSARDGALDDSLELSTKILEYGAANVPVVLNRTEMHERLYGARYPLFVDRLDDLAAVLDVALSDPSAWRDARDVAHRVASGFTAERVRERLEVVLAATRPQGTRRIARRRVVVAGHDLKFAAAIAERLRRAGAEVREDVWRGHSGHDQDTSAAALAWADTIWAEWCLGNAVWYASRARDTQRVVTRLHLQEINTEFPGQLDPATIERLVCVAPFMARDVQKRLGWPQGKIEVIPNAIDTVAFDRPKLPGAHRTLGMIGIMPARKRLDLALDLLERLLEDDPSWRLRIAGALPWETRWAWQRLEERSWFTRQLDRIRTSRRLSGAVGFEGPVANVPGWLAGIGAVLSVSDYESFHLALAEGLASRTVPVVLEREGVDEIFPGVPRHPDVDAAAAWLTALTPADAASLGEDGRALIVQRYELTTVASRWVELLLT